MRLAAHVPRLNHRAAIATATVYLRSAHVYGSTLGRVAPLTAVTFSLVDPRDGTSPGGEGRREGTKNTTYSHTAIPADLLMGNYCEQVAVGPAR